MHPLKFEELIKLPNRESLHSKVYKSGACNKASQIFSANVKMIEALITIPGYSFMNGEAWAKAYSQAMVETNNYDEDSPEISKRASEIWDENDLKGFDKKRLRAQFKEATQNAVMMACLPGREKTHGGLVYFLKSLLIISWSAFEGLAEDLHESVRSEHAAVFAPDLLSKKYRFRSEQSLRDSYEVLFSDDPVVNAAAWNERVKGHALLRHLFIHSNGIADSAFEKQRKLPPIVTEWDAYNDKDEIIVDGDLTRKILTRTTDAGFELINTVSQWLEPKI